jgi:hypothetical protein
MHGALAEDLRVAVQRYRKAGPFIFNLVRQMGNKRDFPTDGYALIVDGRVTPANTAEFIEPSRDIHHAWGQYCKPMGGSKFGSDANSMTATRIMLHRAIMLREVNFRAPIRS